MASFRSEGRPGRVSASLPALGERLARMTDDELRALLPNASYDQGWGASSTIHVAGAPVFVKRLPLADVEVERPRSTRNWPSRARSGG